MSGQENKACVAGVKQTRKAIMNGIAGSVLLAENADPALTERFWQDFQKMTCLY